MNNGILVQNNYRELFVNDSLPVNGIGKNSNTPGINAPNIGSYDPNNLVLVVDTSKEPANSRVSIPLGGTVNCTIFWGDGTSETHTTTGFKTHIYEKPGIYIVQIQGRMTGFGFGFGANTTDNKLKPVKCLSFGNIGLVSIFNSFRDCTNVIECPNSLSSSINDLRLCFRGCIFFNDSNITQWNTANITSTDEMFFGATSFNQNINNWNTSLITSMGSMFNGATSFNQPLNNWNTSLVTNMSSMFGAAIVFNQNLNNWNVRKVTNFSSMFNTARNFNGDLSGWQLGADTTGTTCNSMFLGAFNFTGIGLESWDTSKVTNMFAMLNLCSANTNISSWNTSNVTTMASMFSDNAVFNQPIGIWDVSKVTLMNSMFRNATAFNQNIGAWNVSSVTNFADMFSGRTFNNGGSSDINNWDTSSATNMSTMFQNNTGFNQPLNNWNVRKVTNFGSMFQGATSFNSSLSGWALGADTSGTSCQSMFQSATSFNQDLSSWDTSKVTNMAGMFNGTNAFNQNISGWDVSNVTNMSVMFINNGGFNNGGSSDINNWNVSKVTTMANMFNSATPFNQPISNWNLAGLNINTALDGFMSGKTGAIVYSTANYDALLIGWNNNKLASANGVANWRSDLRPNFGGAKYTSGGAAATARAALVSYGWTITDGGVA